VISLVGGGKVTDPSTFPHEEELYGGGMEKEIALVFVSKITVLESTDKGKADAREKAKEHKLDPDWFMKTLNQLAQACGRVLEKDGVLVTLFE